MTRSAARNTYCVFATRDTQYEARNTYPIAVMRQLFVLGFCLILAAPACAQSLGETTFPNSGAEDAQEPFMRGLLLLHSFEYDHAREAFQEARGTDANFAMAYWGEALTYTHPIWQEQDWDAANVVLSEMPTKARAQASDCERAYLATLDVLYGEGEKEDRDDAYALAMGELAAAYPGDENAATLHALAILSTAHEGRDLEIYDRAGQIALAAFAQNPRHPGAAHYVIHAYDDPINAGKALDAARAYSEIAPDAPHALHMPSHIYFALGMWDQGAELNRRAYEAARRRDEAAGQPLGGHGWHPLYWLHYAELQRGRFEEARRLFDEALSLAESGPSQRAWNAAIAMRANHVIETMDWTGEVAAMDLPLEDVGAETAQRDAFIRGLVAVNRHDIAAAESALQDVQNYLDGREDLGLAEQATALMLEGLVILERGDTEEGLTRLREATSIEDQMPLDFGPPNPAKPSHEALGEVLYSLERPAEAQIEFETALERAPRRLHALSGLAHSALAAGDSETADATQATIREIVIGDDSDGE